MAQVTRNLNVSQMAYVYEKKPTTHYSLSPSTWYTIGSIYSGTTSYDAQMLFTIAAMPSSLKHNRLYGVQFFLQAKVDTSLLAVELAGGGFNANTVTWETAPRYVSGMMASRFADETGTADYYVPKSLVISEVTQEYAHRILNAPALIFDSNSFTYDMKTVLSGGGSPRAVVYYDDTVKVSSKIQYSSGPVNGYKSPRTPTKFSWDYVKANSNYYCTDETWAQASAVFYWKVSTDSEWNTISISGNTKTITLPGNDEDQTFPAASTIQWKVQGTDEDGTTTETDVYQFSTAAGTATATPIAPSGSVEDGSGVIQLKWSLTSTDGQAASRVRVVWRPSSSSTWNELYDVDEPVTSYDVPANTFPAGDIIWRVLAHNIDGTAGSWNSAQFVCVAAPAAVAGLSATEVPLSTISWQSAEQEAYEISIDGEVVKKAYGVDVYDWTVEDPLSDGMHSISVRVQGRFGLWSQPSTITIAIQNAAQNSVVLSGRFGIDADLNWRFGEDPEDTTVQIYRDGTRIASASQQTYTDMLTIGSHSYYVELWDASGNYSRSNTVSGTIKTDATVIAPADGSGAWLSLQLDDRSNRDDSFTWSRTVSTAHVLGARFPVTELSPFEDLTGSFSCAFKDPDDAARLEALRGKTVIIKSRRQNIIIGVLAQMKKNVGEFYVAYSFSLQQIDWEDYRQL